MRQQQLEKEVEVLKLQLKDKVTEAEAWRVQWSDRAAYRREMNREGNKGPSE